MRSTSITATAVSIRMRCRPWSANATSGRCRSIRSPDRLLPGASWPPTTRIIRVCAMSTAARRLTVWTAPPLPRGEHMPAHSARTRGFAYIGLLVAIVIIGAALAAVAEVWSVQSQREREVELLYRGDAIRYAIGAYVAVNPEGEAHYTLDLQGI